MPKCELGTPGEKRWRRGRGRRVETPSLTAAIRVIIGRQKPAVVLSDLSRRGHLGKKGDFGGGVVAVSSPDLRGRAEKGKEIQTALVESPRGSCRGSKWPPLDICMPVRFFYVDADNAITIVLSFFFVLAESLRDMIASEPYRPPKKVSLWHLMTLKTSPIKPHPFDEQECSAISRRGDKHGAGLA